MRFVTFIPRDGHEPVAGEVRGERIVAFAEPGSVADRIAAGRTEPAGGEEWPLEDVELLAPVPEPRIIFCVGLNYAQHAAEGGSEPPERPVIFLKPGSASTGPSAPVPCPDAVRRLDYEAELAVVVGPGGGVAGYAVANDVSARDLQKREPQWTRAKGADGFCPWGPWITTADEAPDPGSIAIRSRVNGELRQDATAADMIFGIEEVLSFIGETCSLRPGDLLLTGTPPGVGFALEPPSFLSAGDRVRVEAEGLGAIENEIV